MFIWTVGDLIAAGCFVLLGIFAVLYVIDYYGTKAWEWIKGKFKGSKTP
jgi:hypothetical protein